MALLPSDVAGSGLQEEGASLITWIGGNTTGEGERTHYNSAHLSITDREEGE